MNTADNGQVAQERRKPENNPCQRVKKSKNGARRRCGQPGAHVWITGEFGRHHDVLCNPCILELRAQGWQVRYQIEGDNPPPLEQQLGE